MRSYKSVVTRLTLLVAAQASLTPALAAELEEVLVTATKRENPLQTTAGSISAVDGDTLAARSVSNIAEVFGFVPNVNFENTKLQGPSLNIRGVSNQANGVGFEPGAPVFVDEIFQVRPVAFSETLFDVERIEVLRGPQGTLFGKNTVGGLIHVISNEPDPDAASGGLDLTLGDRDLRQVRAVVNAPLVEGESAFRIAVAHKDVEGWLKNRTPNTEDLYGENSLNLRAQFFTTLGADGDLLIKADYSETDGTGDQIFDSDGNFTDYSTALGGAGLFSRESDGYMARLRYTLGDWELTSLSSYRSIDSVSKFDQDFSPAPGVLTTFPEDITVFTQELRLASDFGGAVNYIAGLFYLDQETESAIQAAFGNDQGPAAFATDSMFETSSYAAFLSATVDISDRVSLDLGVRYTDEQKDVAFSAIAAGVGGTEGNADIDDSAVSGDISLNYAFSDELYFYGKYAHGFKSGGFDEVSAFGSGALTTIFTGGFIPFVTSEFTFDSETVDNYELGFKATLLNKKLRINTALFFMEYTDKQEQIARDAVLGGIPVVLNTTANAGEAEIRGIEVESVALLNQWLTLESAVGYLDTEFTEFRNPAGGTDLTGNELARSPKWSASVALTLDLPVGDTMAGMARVEAVYKDDNFLGQANSAFAVQDSHALVNIRLGLETEDQRYGVFLYGKNITDEDVFLLALDGVGATPIEPSSWGVEVRARFE